MPNQIDEKLLQKMFGNALIKLVDKLINTTNKEENQIIVKNIDQKYKIFKTYKFNNFLIRPYSQHTKLNESIDLILSFNEELNQIWFKKYKE